MNFQLSVALLLLGVLYVQNAPSLINDKPDELDEEEEKVLQKRNHTFPDTSK